MLVRMKSIAILWSGHSTCTMYIFGWSGVEKCVHNEEIVHCTKVQQLVPIIIALSGCATVVALLCILRVSPVPDSAIKIPHNVIS